MWFATEEGLNKFDGIHFIGHYKYTQSISGNELNRIYADKNKPIIWIATQRAGLNAYNYETQSMELFSHEDDNPNSIITNDITDIKPANGNNLWISTFHYGVDLFDTKTSVLPIIIIRLYRLCVQTRPGQLWMMEKDTYT